jgi:hypothetical protein
MRNNFLIGHEEVDGMKNQRTNFLIMSWALILILCATVLPAQGNTKVSEFSKGDRQNPESAPHPNSDLRVLGNTATAQGVTGVAPINALKSASCNILYYRWLYQDVRSKEEEVLIAKFRKGRTLTQSETSDLKEIVERLASLVPGSAENNELITVTWSLEGLDQTWLDILRSEWKGSDTTIGVSDERWHSTTGYWPSEIHLEYLEDEKTVQLKFATNPVDACFGRSDITVDLKLSGDRTLTLQSQLPRPKKAKGLPRVGT